MNGYKGDTRDMLRTLRRLLGEQRDYNNLVRELR